MCDDRKSQDKLALERMQFLREERDRHVELLEKLNFRVSFGAVVVLATALFGLDNPQQLGAALGALREVCMWFAIGGAVCVIAGLVIHWNFRDTRAGWCAEAMRSIAASEPGWENFLKNEDPFAGLPKRRPFSWLLGIGVIAVLASGAILVWTALTG